MRIDNDKILTQRERDIVLLLFSGKNKKTIADTLHLSVSTIKTNVENIYRKFDVHNRVELVIFLIKNNIVNLNNEIKDE